MNQRFEDNIIKAITTSDTVLLKNTLEKSERIIHWNQTLDGILVLALCVKFFDPHIVEMLYPSSTRSLPLPNEIFTYLVEHGSENVVDAFGVSIIATINDKLDRNDMWGDDSDAEQTLESLKNASSYISALVNHPACNLIEHLLQEKIDPKFLSLLLIKSVEWDHHKLLKHSIEQITKKDRSNWEDLSYKSWNATHIQNIQRVYTNKVNSTLNDFLDQASPHTWENHATAHQTVLMYSTPALKDLLHNGANTQLNIPQKALDHLSMENALKEFTASELAILLKMGAGRTIEQYGFLSRTPIAFEIVVVLEQYQRMHLGKRDANWDQQHARERQRFHAFCAPLLSCMSYAFSEKRMDLELYYRSLHNTPPNQTVSVLDCFHTEDRAWAENLLLHEQIGNAPVKIGKKSKI